MQKKALLCHQTFCSDEEGGAVSLLMINLRLHWRNWKCQQSAVELSFGPFSKILYENIGQNNMSGCVVNWTELAYYLLTVASIWGAQLIQTFHLGGDDFIFLHWRGASEHFIMLRPHRPPWRHIWGTRAAVLIIFSQRKCYIFKVLNPYRNCRDIQAGSVPVGGTRLSWLYQFEKYFRCDFRALFCTAF